MARKGCENGRIHLGAPAQRYLWARSGGHCANPSCRVYLFADAGDLKVEFGELAHIIAASDQGPRADAKLPALRRADVENIVLLCANCHTQVDRAPGFYTVEVLREWQRVHMAELAELFGAIEYATRPEVDEAARRLLAKNRAVFETYGPQRAHREGRHGNEEARQWRRKVREIILPNNRRLLSLCDRNRELLTPEEQPVIELFRQHVDDLEARHFHGEIEPGSVQFPTDIEKVFRDG
jgi:hypothetical protein